MVYSLACRDELRRVTGIQGVTVKVRLQAAIISAIVWGAG